MEKLINVANMELENDRYMGEYGECGINISNEQNIKMVLDFINKEFVPFEIKIEKIQQLTDSKYPIIYMNEKQSLALTLYHFDTKEKNTNELVICLYHENLNVNYNGDNSEYRNKEYVTKAIERFHNLLENN